MAKTAVDFETESNVSGYESLEVDSAPSGEGAILAERMRAVCGIELPPEARDAEEEKEEELEKAEDVGKSQEGAGEATKAESEVRRLPRATVAEVGARNGTRPAPKGQERSPDAEPTAATSASAGYGDEAEAKVAPVGLCGARPKLPVTIAAVFPQPACPIAPLHPSPASGRGSASASASTSSTAPADSSTKPRQAGSETGASAEEEEEEEHYDVLLLHSEEDWSHRKTFLALASRCGWKVTALTDFLPQETRFNAFSSALRRSTYTVLLLSAAFLRDVWVVFSYQTALTHSLEARRCSVIPVLCEEGLDLPPELKVFISVKSWLPNYEDQLGRAINTKHRRSREKAAGLKPSSTATSVCDGPNRHSQDRKGPATSVGETFLQRRPELRPDRFVAQVLTDSVFRQLCIRLDQDNPLDRHWVSLADSLGFSRDHIEILRAERSPTAAVIASYCQHQLEKGQSAADIRANLRQSLKASERADCLQILNKDSG